MEGNEGRRRFVLAALGMGALTIAGGVPAMVAKAADKAPPDTTSMKAPEISDEARALHSVLVARWGKDLNDVQKQGLLEAIENNVQSGQALRAKTLYNGQEPSTVFMISAPGPR
jgi:hypothetical protein